MLIKTGTRYLSFCVIVNSAVLIALALYFFIGPLVVITYDLRDPGLSDGSMPVFAYRWHKKLSKKYEPWALERIESHKAARLEMNDISGTEWPMFSSVFYLWATESLQLAWEDNNALSESMPSEYAKGAIAAAAALIHDPTNATWVRQHWGDDYLETENAFYRMLLISGLTSYQQLSGDDRYQETLLSQVSSFAKEIDSSPSGLLDDYPGQCYPIDVLPAISAILRADAILGTDHSAMAERAVRGFEGAALDKRTGLPAYYADSKTGQGYGDARGVGISYMLIWAPELWPHTAEQWYADFTENFWQESRYLAGFREFSSLDYGNEWLVDVDAGPVIAGYGTAASAFGIGAARTHGRFDHAYTLSAQALVVAWPLIDGTLLTPRLLSNLSDAPFVGEAALLFNFTRLPISEGLDTAPQALPLIVWFVLLVYAVIGLLVIGLAISSAKRWIAGDTRNGNVRLANIQFALWCILLVLAILSASYGALRLGIGFLVAAQFLPRKKGL